MNKAPCLIYLFLWNDSLNIGKVLRKSLAKCITECIGKGLHIRKITCIFPSYNNRNLIGKVQLLEQLGGKGSFLILWEYFGNILFKAQMPYPP